MVIDCTLLVLLCQLKFVTEFPVTFFIDLQLNCRQTAECSFVAISNEETILCMTLSWSDNNEFRQHYLEQRRPGVTSVWNPNDIQYVDCYVSYICMYIYMDILNGVGFYGHYAFYRLLSIHCFRISKMHFLFFTILTMSFYEVCCIVSHECFYVFITIHALSEMTK